MSLHKLKSLTGVFVVLAFVSMSVFGLFGLSHMDGAPMMNCPYAQGGSSICENSLGHINDWRQFSNTTFSTLLIFSLLILGAVLYFLNKQDFLNQKQHFYRWKYYFNNEKSYFYTQKITKWLSLFENSPSFSFARHS